MNPRDRFRRWRAASKLTAVEAGVKIKCHRSYIYELERDYGGKNLIPGRNLAMRIEIATDGYVKASSWEKLARKNYKAA